jgi:hypothetical protein
MSAYQYEIVDGWFSIEMKELAPLPQAANGGLKETPPAAANGGLKETPTIQPKPYEFDESKLIELDPIDDAFLLETDKDIVKILNDLF